MEGLGPFLYFLALKERDLEEIRARFPVIAPWLRALGEELEIQGTRFRLRRPLRLAWFAPLFQAYYHPADPEAPLAWERLLEAAYLSSEEEEVQGEGPLQVARLFQRGSRLLKEGAPKAALQTLAQGLAQLESLGLPFPAMALALLAQAQAAFRPGEKARKTAAKALARAQTPLARTLAEAVLAQVTKGGPFGD